MNFFTRQTIARGAAMNKILVLLPFLLAACVDAQPAPDVTERSSDEFTIEVVSDQLVRPWGVAVLPDGRYFVTEMEGTAQIIGDDGMVAVAGLPDDILVAGQGGLLGVLLAPDFSTSGVMFLSYTYGDLQANGTAVYKARLNNSTLVDGDVIFKSTAKAGGAHNGGRMVMLPDNTLVVSLGDGFRYREKAQVLDNTLGKIVRLKTDGTAAPDNAFVNKKDASPEIYTYGHRNVQGLAFDAPTGRLWAHEHGPRGGDELNVIKSGNNYGWPLATTGVDYNGASITPYQSYPGTEPPVYDWVPSIAPSGLAIYRGDLFKAWRGDALIGALANQSLWRVDLDGDEVVGVERLLGDVGERIRDVKIDRDGAVLVLSEAGQSGRLIRLTP